MGKQKIYFEKVPVEVVRKIAKLDLPDTAEDNDTRGVKEKRRFERAVSSKQVVSERAKYDDTGV